ncbi:uncharacterized protein LOC118399186 [Oncorhynchus keta]|uniref:uncharacterized protein LOC118399186 n=1 Tax=Oncorhynchus keta TaxID=8018 RepID=UPI0015F9D8AD|nr:uncharacterized protein LOC118399186 [Oncorhynchus keta]
MEESWDSIEEAGDYKTDAARHLPSCSCQQITEHKGTEVGEEILTDETYKSMAAFKVKNDEGSAPFSDIHSHSKIMAQDLQRKAAERRATEVTHDKCPSFSERSCPVGLTNVQEICILSSGFDVKKIRGRDSAAVEVGTIVSPPPFSSSLSKNMKGNVTLSPTEKIAVTQGLSASSLSDHARYSREVVNEKTYADVSHQTLPLADIKKGKEKMSFTLLPVMEKQQKRKAGRPYKKKTLVKMAKLLAIGQERYSDATEIHGDTLTPSRKQTQEKKKDEMFPPTTSSDTWFGCNSTSDSSNHLTIAHSDDIISASQIAGPSISVELNQPSRIQKTSKTTQKEEFKITEVSALKLTTVTKGQYSPIEQALTHNTLVPSENALKVQKRTGRNKTMISKGGNRRTQAFKRNRMNPSSLFTPQSQSSNATSQEKNDLGLSQDETPLQSSDIKMEPKYLSDTSVLDVTNNVKEHQKREPPSKNFTEASIKSPGIMSKCFDLSITQKNQGARSDMKREIKDNVTANISAVGNQGEMTPRTQELSRLKSIEDVLKLKRKAGRPFKKNRLFKMDKLVAIAQEGRTNDPENSGMTKECVPKFPAYNPLKSKVKKEKTDTKTLASNSPTSPSRRSNRTCKTTPKTVQKMQVLTHTLAQSVLSVPSNLIELKSEDTTLISATVSPIILCSAEIFPQQESHRCGKPPKKNTKVNKHMTTAVPHPPIFAVVSKALAEIVSTGNGKEANKDIGSKRKYKRVPGTRGVSELLCTNGIPQGDIHTQTNRDEVYSKTSAPTVPHSQNTRKREVKNKKGTEKAAVPLSDETVLPVSDCQVQSHSASQETPLPPSKIKTQSDTLYLTPRTVRKKKNPKTCKEIKKTSPKVEKAQVPSLDPSLGVEHRCHDVPQVDHIRQMEAVIESVMEDLHKPLKPSGQQKKFKEETSNICALEQTAFLASDNLLEQRNHCTLPQYYFLTKSGLKHAKPKMSTKMKSKACSKGKLFKNAKKAAVITSDPSIGAENGCLEMPSHFTQAEKGEKGDVKTNKCVGKHEKEAVISVTGDHLETAAHKPHQRKGPRKKLKDEDSSVSKAEQVESTTSDSQLRLHDHNDSQQVSLLVSAGKTESGIKHIMPEMEMTNKPKTCRKRKILSKQSSKITETPTPPSSKPSLGVEYRYSEMATPFTHVDQGQNILDTPKGSKASNGNTGSNHPISNVRHSRRPSKSNSHITTDLMQDQAILSVASHPTNQPTSPVSTTVSSTAAQGQVTELVSSLCTDKRPHKIGRPPKNKKKKSQRPKRTGIDKNITDDDKVCVKFLSAFVKEELIEEEKSLENRGKEKNGKGKKGKILQTDNVKVKDGNALADDKLVLQVPIDDAGDSISIAIDPISAVIPKHKKGGRIATGKRVQKIASTPNIPGDQQCMNMSPEEMSLCLSNISEKHRKRKVDSSSADFVNADINVLNLKDDLSDRSEIPDSSLLGTQRVKNKGKIKSKTITEEQTLATSVVKEMVWLDLQTTIAALKKKRGRPFKKSTLMRMAKQQSCEQQKSNTSRQLSVNKTQSCKSMGTSKGGKMHKFNPMSTTSRRDTRASVAMENEDLVLKQQQDDIWEITDVSSNIFFPIVTNSRSISVQEIETSETIFSVDAGATQGIQQVESTPLTTPLTKLPHKVTGVKKRRRRNKTGWATKVKSKQPLSKVNCGGTLEVFVQSSIDNTGLSFNSSLCNSLTENDTLESVEQEKECRAHVKAVTNYNRVCVEKEINCGDQPLTARAKLQHSSVLLHNFKTRKPMSCHFCSRSFRHITAYTIHKRIHTGEKPYSCQKCGKSFAHLSKLKSHSNIHKQHGPIQCPCCITQSPNKDDLIDHFKIHMKGTKRFSLINKTRRDKEIQIHPYTDYIESPVTLNGRKFLRCSTCFKYFFSKATLKLHLQTHSGVRRFTCKVCGKMFSTFSSFNAHEKTHWPVKPYACSVCGKGFVLLRELKTHSHMHSGEMPFFCNHCGQAFSDFSSLRTHQVSKVCFEATDEGDGNKVDIEGFLVEQRADGQINTPMYFKCQICKQLNRHWCQYILHLQTHTNDKPNLCEICGQRYEVPELCVHCKVCCKSSGEERACNSSLSEVWHEPQSLQNPMHVTEIDFLYNDNQEMLSTDDQHPKCKEPEPLPPLETMEEYSSDVLLQNPKPAYQIPGNGLEINRPSPSNSMCASSAILSPSVMSCNSVCVVQQPSGFHSRLQTHAPCDRYRRGQCGKSFNRWNKLWLHQGRHREKRCSFSCTQCNLEFRFLGSYREHMQEHAAQRPYVCPLCPKTYITKEDLNTHLCENHQPCESLKCDTCEKGFTSFRNLERHRLLHRAASSHYCLPCKLPFPSYLALKNHLKAHKARPVIPLPEGLLEPLRFPYHCRKCNARFTTTDLLQAHQVCHLIGGKKTYSSSANVVSASLTSKLSNKPRARVTPLSPTTVPSLLLSKKRNMYRYPHPDRLYVVPKISSQPPVIVSDTEEEPQEILNFSLSSVHDSPCNTVSLEHEGPTSPSNNCCEANNSDLPQCSCPSCVLIYEPTQCMPKIDTPHMPTHEPPCPLDKGHQNVPPQRWKKSKGNDDAFFRASTFVISRGKKQRIGFECADCWVRFSDVSELHEHYLHHARGVK